MKNNKTATAQSATANKATVSTATAQTAKIASTKFDDGGGSGGGGATIPSLNAQSSVAAPVINAPANTPVIFIRP